MTIANYQQVFIADYYWLIIILDYVYVHDLLYCLLTISTSVRFCNLVKDPQNVNKWMNELVKWYWYKNQSDQRNTLPTTNLSNTDPTWSAMELNPGLQATIMKCS